MVNYIMPTAVNAKQFFVMRYIAHAVSEQLTALNNKTNALVFIKYSI